MDGITFFNFYFELMAEIQAKMVDIEVAAVSTNLQDSVLSSPNKKSLKKLEEFGKSSMKIKKSIELRIKPWGNPQSTERRLDNLLLKFTYCCLFASYDLNQSKATPRTPYTLNLCNRILWITQSKALGKSRNIEMT